LDKYAREGGLAGVVFGILAVVIVGAGLYSVLFNTSDDKIKMIANNCFILVETH